MILSISASCARRVCTATASLIEASSLVMSLSGSRAGTMGAAGLRFGSAAGGGDGSGEGEPRGAGRLAPATAFWAERCSQRRAVCSLFTLFLMFCSSFLTSA